MRHKPQDEGFINDRCTQPEFLVRMHAVLQDQPDLTGCIREEIESFGANVWPSASNTTLINFVSETYLPLQSREYASADEETRLVV